MIEHKAYLNAPPAELIEAMSATALKNGFDVDAKDGGVLIRAPLGHVTIIPQGHGGDLTFGAESPPQLQLLKDLYAGRIAGLGLESALVWRATGARAPLNQMLATVVSNERISPNFARVRLSGDFSAFLRPGAGLHFRLLFSQTGADWPTLDERGLTQWPDGPASWHRPPYTVRKMGPNADWIDVDIVLHEGGRVTDWCAVVEPGEEIALHGPSGTTQPTAKWLGLIGDETALPVILRMVEDAPDGTTGQAIVLVRDLEDAQTVETASSVQIDWRLMQDNDAPELIRELNTPADDLYIFFAAERAQATQARAIYKELGLSPKAVKAASYWTA